MDKSNFGQKNFTNFIIKAKQNTYAKSGEGGENILNDGSKELFFKEGNFKYRDRYFGFNPFVGQEIVFYNNKAFWAMNYYGRMISKKGDFKYFNKAHGTVKKFMGQEKIFYKGKLAYKLRYLGGAVAS